MINLHCEDKVIKKLIAILDDMESADATAAEAESPSARPQAHTAGVLASETLISIELDLVEPVRPLRQLN